MVHSEAQELLSGGPAAVLAESNALAKVRGARLPADLRSGTFVLGTDTLVTIDRAIMGKPASAAEAAGMLAALSGRTHQVVSGVALVRTGGGGSPASAEGVQVACAVTDVTFLTLDRAQVDAYVDSGEWKGKAGGYAVQGLAALFVSEVRGEYSNVVGLPLCLLAGMFSKLGFDLVSRRWLEPA